MKNCTLKFIIGDVEISVDVDSSTEILNQDGSLNQNNLADVFKNSKDKKKIIDAILDHRNTSTRLNKTDFATAVPNHTMHTLRTQFSGELDFGKNFEANVLLVDKIAYKGNYGIPNYRTVVNGQEKFVIKREDLKKFAAYTRLRSAINDLMSQTSTFSEEQRDNILNGDNGLIKLVEKLSTSDQIGLRNPEIIQQEIDKAIDQVVSDLNKELERLNNELSEFENNPDAEVAVRRVLSKDKPNKQEQDALLKYNNGDSKKIIIEHRKYLSNKINQIKNKLNNQNFTTPEITSLKDELKKSSKSKRKIPSDVKLFLEDFINNPSFYSRNLSESDHLTVMNFIRMILGKSDKRKHGDRIADLINMQLIYPVQDKSLKSNQVKIKTDDLIKILIENLDLSEEQVNELKDLENLNYNTIKKYLEDYFISIADNYKIVTNSGQFDKNKDVLILKTDTDTFEALLQDDIEELYNGKNIFDYKSHHIYSLTINNQKKYCFSTHYIGLFDKSFKFYDNINDAILAIDRKVSGMYIQDFSKDNFETKSDRSIFSVKVNQFYQEAGVISKYAHPYGKYRVTNMTTNDFISWLYENFNNEQQKKILNWLQNKTEVDENQDIDVGEDEEVSEWNELNNNITNIDFEKAALFLSYFGYIANGLNLNSSYRPVDKELDDFIDNFKDDKVYYSIISSYSVKGNRYINVAKNKSNETNLISYDTSAKRPEPILHSLKALAEEFNKRGIPTQVIYDSDIEQILKIKDSPKAFVKDGVIYLNGSKASVSDGYHEYTHILLGMLKAYNKDAYNKLLSLYRNTFEEESIKQKIESLREQYQNLYKDVDDINMLEELFAEDYGKFLLKKSISSNVSLFTELDIESKAIANDFFNKITTEDYSNITLYELLSNFSSAIQRNKKTKQFILPNYSQDSEEAVNDFIENAKVVDSRDLKFDGENSLLKRCEK